MCGLPGHGSRALRRRLTRVARRAIMRREHGKNIQTKKKTNKEKKKGNNYNVAQKIREKIA